jgi:MFS family permease
MTTIHRLLDEAFSGIDPTPEVQDLKEEIRANLQSRAAELEATGMSSDAAAEKAVRELGDIRELVDELPAPDAGSRPSWAPPSGEVVRPKPGFVVRTVVLSLLGAAGLAVLVLDALGVFDAGFGVLLGAVVAVAAGMGYVIGDALMQETSTNFALPPRRAIGFGLAGGLTLFGLGFGWIALKVDQVGWVALGVAAIVAGIVLFSYLGATKTNRHKPWVVRLQSSHNEIGDRFSDDPESAARFGIYTVVIWIVAFAVFLVLSFTVGWAWSWLALLGGFAVMLIVLARMLFPASKQ